MVSSLLSFFKISFILVAISGGRDDDMPLLFWIKFSIANEEKILKRNKNFYFFKLDIITLYIKKGTNHYKGLLL